VIADVDFGIEEGKMQVTVDGIEKSRNGGLRMTA